MRIDFLTESNQNFRQQEACLENLIKDARLNAFVTEGSSRSRKVESSSLARK